MPTKHFKISQVLITYPQCERTKEELLEWLRARGDVMCAIVCREDHHETDGRHLHAWVKLDRQKDVTAKQWGTLFDWDGVHGNYTRVTCSTRSIADTVKYVMKDGDFKAWNCNPDALSNPEKSHERKYDNERIINTPMKQLVDEGVINIKEVPQYLRGVQIYKLLDKPNKKSKCRGIWLTGRAGCGKSTWAEALGNHLGGYFEKSQNRWWDGYDKEKVVILNDLDTETLLHYLKIWADKFPCKGEIKNGYIWLHHDWFVVTSNFSIAEICEKTGDARHFLDALRRRFHELFLPQSAEYFQFDPDCDWENPDEITVEPKTPTTPEECTTKTPEPPKKKTPPQEEPNIIHSTPGKTLPTEPDLDAPTPVIEDGIGCMCGSGYGTFNGDLGDLPQLASEPEQEPEEESRDSLSEFCDTTSIDWEALHAAARDDPSYTMSGGCEEGASYSTSGEAEPSSGEDL